MKKRNFVLRGFNAFTLAEVLITLVIIGVIATLTVPSLIQRTNNQEYVSGLKKAYSVLSQALQQIIADEGAPESSEDAWNAPNNITNTFKKHLNVVKECSNDCMKQRYKSLYGTAYGSSNWSISIDYQAGSGKLVLSDGMQIALGGSVNCTASTHFNNGAGKICGRINVDVNGEKGPNKLGRDLFWFSITEDGRIFPCCSNETLQDTYMCGDTNKYQPSDGDWTAGWGCARRVLTEDAMNY